MHPLNQPDPVLVSVNNAADMLGVSRATIYKLLNSGTVRAVRSGGRTLIPTQTLREYAESLAAYVPPPRGGESLRSASTTQAALAADRMLRIEVVMARTGLGKTSIYAQAAAGRFPLQIALGGRASGWRESDVNDWIADPAGYQRS